MGIEFKTDVCIPVEIPFQDADICLVLGNLLENAVEAAAKKLFVELMVDYIESVIIYNVGKKSFN